MKKVTISGLVMLIILAAAFSGARTALAEANYVTAPSKKVQVKGQLIDLSALNEERQPNIVNEEPLVLIQDEFEWYGRKYIKYYEDYDAISQEEVGEPLAVIESSVDQSLIGCTIYRYTPVNCEAIVVVDRNEQLEIFQFFTFTSYEDNQDEHASEYLELFGIYSSEDIEKIEIYYYPDAYSIELEYLMSSQEEIQEFYTYFERLADSSDAYFQALSDHVPPGSTSGTTALENSRPIHIYASNGLKFNMVYYPKIEFISRYKITDNFAAFLDQKISLQ